MAAASHESLELMSTTPFQFFSICEDLNDNVGKIIEDPMSRLAHRELDFVSDITEADLRYYTQLQPFFLSIFDSKVHTQAFVDLLKNHESPAAYVVDGCFLSCPLPVWCEGKGLKHG
jgi:hypothetical protein